MNKVTLFPFVSSTQKAGFIGAYNGKALICMDPDLKAGSKLVVSLSSNGQAYFGNIAEKGIEVEIVTAEAV